ncbi:hypothetical protein [Microbacterium sp.]|uniref:hypothetical protein n=1 Tax=Microbacterium sp. TaxID=51671 RepID=UPI002FE11FD4
MVNQTSVMPGERVFRRHPLRAAIGALALSVVLSAATLFILPRFLPRNMDVSTRGLIVAVVAIALTAAVWVSTFWFRNMRIVVRPDVVEIGRPGARETYVRSATGFRSQITEHRTNGLRSGVTRALIVHSAGREITVELPGFTRATFNELMAELNPIAQPRLADPVDDARARAHLPRTFAVDASRERRLASGLTIATVVCVLAMAATVVLVLQPGFLDGELSALILVAPITGLAAIACGILAALRARIARSAPVQISLTTHGIRIDDVDHPYDRITRLWLTPPAYPTRRLRIERTNGRPARHTLSSARIEMSPDYGDLLLTLRADTAQRPGLISMDLE